MPAPPRAGILLLPATQPNTRRAQKSAPKQNTLLSSLIQQSGNTISRPFVYSCPSTRVLPTYLCHSTTLSLPSSRHSSSHNSSQSHNPKLPSPQLRAILPIVEPPPQHVQTPRKIFLFDNHLPAHLVTRIVSICPPNISLNAIPRYPPAAWPSSPTNKYRPTGYS